MFHIKFFVNLAETKFEPSPVIHVIFGCVVQLSHKILEL